MTEKRIKEAEKVGCLIIHGFGGGVYEIAPLADRLQRQGYEIVCPVLQGHTGIRRDLGRCTYEDWVLSAEKELQTLQKYCNRVAIIGFSMGGLIAVHLVRKYRADCLALLNMPIYYWDVKRILLNLREDLRTGRYTNLKRYARSSIDKPLRALWNFRCLLSITRPLLEDITVPIYIAQAEDDDTVQPRSAEYIYRHVQSADKQLRYYGPAGHTICLSPSSEQLLVDVAGFLKTQGM